MTSTNMASMTLALAILMGGMRRGSVTRRNST
jgi:hypothetical protein